MYFDFIDEPNFVLHTGQNYCIILKHLYFRPYATRYLSLLLPSHVKQVLWIQASFSISSAPYFVVDKDFYVRYFRLYGE